MEKLLQLIQEENERLSSALGHTTIGMMPIRVFLLEKYLEAIKASKHFNHDVYHILSIAFKSKSYEATCGIEEDPEEIERVLKVRAMMDELTRS